MVRLPKGKGKIIVTCPSCHQKFEKRTSIMFGYVVINKPELKIKDYDKYQNIIVVYVNL